MKEYASNATLGGVGREKYWEELNDSEKIERMRNVVKSLQHTNDRLRARISNLENNFREHDHTNNEVMIKYKRSFGESDVVGSSKESKYF